VRDECVAYGGSGDKRKREEEGTGLSDDDADLEELSEEFLNQNKRKEKIAQVKAWLQKIINRGSTIRDSSRTRPITVARAIDYVTKHPNEQVTFYPVNATVKQRLLQAFPSNSNVTITDAPPHAPAQSSSLADRLAFTVTA
tara:strand:+ start:245 stop:667 length:423 start_codon:yes stop_codon:yes gene_type:complete